MQLIIKYCFPQSSCLSGEYDMAYGSDRNYKH
jgi:hypothetical protein